MEKENMNKNIKRRRRRRRMQKAPSGIPIGVQKDDVYPVRTS